MKNHFATQLSSFANQCVAKCFALISQSDFRDSWLFLNPCATGLGKGLIHVNSTCGELNVLNIACAVCTVVQQSIGMPVVCAPAGNRIEVQLMCAMGCAHRIKSF